MQKDITRFVTDEVYPRMWDYIGQLFPDFELRRGNWESPNKIDGQPAATPRKNKTVITKKEPTKAYEQGRGAVSLIDLWLERTKSSEPIEAIKVFAETVGLELPSTDKEAYKEYKKRVDALQTIADEVRAALKKPEGKRVLEYLTKPKEEGGRGYSLETAEAMNFGALTKDAERKLQQAGLISDKEDYTEKFPLVIVFESGSNIYGFKFRSVEGKEFRNTLGLPKKEQVYGLNALQVQSRSQRDSNLTIVESETDALHAKVAGLQNIAAIAGGNKGEVISSEQVNIIKKKGYNYITLLMDSDDSGKSFIEAALPILSEAGFSVFIASLPEGTGKDTDEYLNRHSGESLQNIIEEACPISVYKYRQLIEEYTSKQKDGRITEKDWHSLKSDIVRLFAGISFQQSNGKEYHIKLTPTDIARLTAEFNSGFCAEYLTADSIKAEALALKEASEKGKQILEAQKISTSLTEAAASGNMSKFFEAVEKAKGLQSIGEEARFSKLLEPYSLDDMQSIIEEESAGIKTDYTFQYLTRKGTEQETLTLPAGAVSFICAGTSHGKSKMLQNLALQAVNDNTEGTVLYFSYEEDRERVSLQFLNCYAGIRFNSNNLRTLTDYYKHKRTNKDYLEELGNRHGLINCPQSDFEKFHQKEKEFNNILKEGKLRIFYEDLSSQSLISAIRYIKRQTPVKAVFIDYMQLLTLEGSELTIREELKEIGKQLKNLAVEEKLPIVVAAQLNREANTPLDMFSQNIAESADIERIANIVLCLWNSSFKPYKKGNNYGRWNDTEKGKLQKLGFDIDGEERTLYAILSKNRGGAVSIESILKFDGNTGRITQKEIPDAATRAAEGDFMNMEQ